VKPAVKPYVAERQLAADRGGSGHEQEPRVEPQPPATSARTAKRIGVADGLTAGGDVVQRLLRRHVTAADSHGFDSSRQVCNDAPHDLPTGFRGGPVPTVAVPPDDAPLGGRWSFTPAGMSRRGTARIHG